MAKARKVKLSGLDKHAKEKSETKKHEMQTHHVVRKVRAALPGRDTTGGAPADKTRTKPPTKPKVSTTGPPRSSTMITAQAKAKADASRADRLAALRKKRLAEMEADVAHAKAVMRKAKKK
jgi:hypothetical protein